MSTNWSNRTIWTGDNLPIMPGMNSASVDLFYLDPPFNSKANYAAAIGSEAARAEFKHIECIEQHAEVDLMRVRVKFQEHIRGCCIE